MSAIDVDMTVTVTNCKLREVTEAKLVFVGEGERNKILFDQVLS